MHSSALFINANGGTWRANRKPAGEASVNEGNDCPRIFWATRRVLGLDMPSQTDRQQEAVGLFFLAAIAPKLPSPPRQHEVGRRGPPMDDALRPVDRYRRRPILPLAPTSRPTPRHIALFIDQT